MYTLRGAVGTAKRAAAHLAELQQRGLLLRAALCALIAIGRLFSSCTSVWRLLSPSGRTQAYPVLLKQLLLEALPLLPLLAVLAMLAMERRNAHTGSSLGISGVQANTSSAQPDSSTNTYADLHSASSDGNTAEVLRLLAEGVAVDTVDDSGSTALHEAVAGGRAEAAKVLVDNGADVNAKDADGYTPLALSLLHKPNSGLVRLLLSKGADPNLSLGHGRLSLLAHAVHGCVDSVGPLLQAGAKGRLRPAGDFTDALLAACFINSPAMVYLLLQHDTKPTKEGLESLLKGQLRNNRFNVATQLVLQLEQEHPGSAASVLSTTPHNAAAFSLAMLKGWAGGSRSSATEQAAVVEKERVCAEQSTGARELLLAYEAKSAADKVAEGGNVA